jgi:hypothetical protein
MAEAGLGLGQRVRVMLRFADASGTVVAKANDPEHARRLAVCLNAFHQAETTDIERIAMRRLRRSYWKKHPPREEWERALR